MVSMKEDIRSRASSLPRISQASETRGSRSRSPGSNSMLKSETNTRDVVYFEDDGRGCRSI